MLRHKELFDPIQRTREMRLEEFTKYIDICEQNSGPADAQKVSEIRDIFFNSHLDVREEDLNRVWKFAVEKVMGNPGLAEFILDYGGAKSGYFFPWVETISKSPSAALEMAYNAGYDLSGNWVDSVPKSDEINFFVRNVPTFVYNRQRQLYVADLVTTAQENATAARKSKVVDLGAGRLAWARHHGFRFRPERQEILAFDVDKTVDPDSLFEYPLASLKLSYQHEDMMTAINDRQCQNADVILLGGVASYYPLWVFAETIAKPAYHRLRTGGVFFFDLQLDCPQYVWTVKLFGWPEIKLMDSVAKAIDAVEQMREKLRRDGMEFGAEYVLDAHSEFTSSVMIAFTRLN